MTSFSKSLAKTTVYKGKYDSNYIIFDFFCIEDMAYDTINSFGTFLGHTLSSVYPETKPLIKTIKILFIEELHFFKELKRKTCD